MTLTILANAAEPKSMEVKLKAALTFDQEPF